MVNRDVIHVDPSKFFLGLAGYYRRFIENFSKIAKPLTLLTQKNKTYVWGDEQDEAFRILKEKLCNAPVLALPDGPNDFVVYCDASKQDSLSRKERLKPRRVRAMSITIHSGLKTKILEAQGEGSKDLKAPAKWLKGLETHFERQDDGGILTFSIVSGFHQLTEVGEGQLIGLEIMQEMTKKIIQIKERLKTTRSRQKSYADKRRKPLEFKVGDRVLLKVSPWKGVLPQELSCIHDTFHVSNLKKCLAESDVQVPLEEIEIDENLRFVEEPIEIVERDVKKLKRRRIPLVKVHWNSR
ncbi:putative reverse transcriptase domain-containing protein [Tanacetum coccineum]